MKFLYRMSTATGIGMLVVALVVFWGDKIRILTFLSIAAMPFGDDMSSKSAAMIAERGMLEPFVLAALGVIVLLLTRIASATEGRR